MGPPRNKLTTTTTTTTTQSITYSGTKTVRHRWTPRVDFKREVLIPSERLVIDHRLGSTLVPQLIYGDRTASVALSSDHFLQTSSTNVLHVVQVTNVPQLHSWLLLVHRQFVVTRRSESSSQHNYMPLTPDRRSGLGDLT